MIIEKFLRLRMIDLTRTNARLLLKSLNIQINEYLRNLFTKIKKRLFRFFLF